MINDRLPAAARATSDVALNGSTPIFSPNLILIYCLHMLIDDGASMHGKPLHYIPVGVGRFSTAMETPKNRRKFLHRREAHDWWGKRIASNINKQLGNPHRTTAETALGSEFSIFIATQGSSRLLHWFCRLGVCDREHANLTPVAETMHVVNRFQRLSSASNYS